jgi:tRNA-2-methylthio-N6-dimethylallyladenosine synthase
VTLLGQNVNAWRGTIDGARADFAELLHSLRARRRARSLHDLASRAKFTQRLIDAHAPLPKLAPHVHLPVQSGSTACSPR